jgi:hypothetical protein
MKKDEILTIRCTETDRLWIESEAKRLSEELGVEVSTGAMIRRLIRAAAADQRNQCIPMCDNGTRHENTDQIQV